jgi:hypothetical protein
MLGMSKPAFVYCIKSCVSQKVYIGWTGSNPQRRFVRHCRDAARGSPGHFHCAIREYGSDPALWRIYVLARTESHEEAKRLEIKFIAEFQSDVLGYNMTCGGDGVIDHTGDIAAKISRTLKGRGAGIPKSLATRARMSMAQRLRATPEYRLQSSQRWKAYFATHPVIDETRNRQRLARLGKKLGNYSEQHRQNISDGVKEWWKKRKVLEEGKERCSEERLPGFPQARDLAS